MKNSCLVWINSIVKRYSNSFLSSPLLYYASVTMDTHYIYYYYYCRQHSKALYLWGVRRRRKTGEVEVKRKWWVLAQPPYFRQGNGSGDNGDRPPDAED